MKKIVLMFVLASLPVVALAQAPAPPPSPDVSAGAIGALFNSLSQQLGQSVDNYRRIYQENQALKQKLADLDAYLKACGDKPGCTQPVPEVTKK